MQEKDIAVIKGLIQVMWADGELAEAEREMLGSILVNMGCSAEELQEIAGMMKEPPSVDSLLKDLPDKESRRDVIKIVYAMALADDDYAE
nr:TerB family tellurite resistance protein [bacterium]